MKTTKRILSLLLCMVMILGIIPVFASAEGEAYVKVTSAADVTTGQYVVVVNSGYALGVVDGTWITAVQPTVDGDQIADATGMVWTLTVTGSTVTMKDSNGTFIKPKGGNNNGLASAEYAWTWDMADDGTVTFKGAGSDTVTLASNVGSANKFRGYKNTTVAGNASGYPSKFTLYKLSDTSGETPEVPECTEHTWDEGVQTVAPTVSTVGEMVYTCSVCGATKTEEVAKLPATGATYVQYTAETLVSGTYILVTSNGYAMNKLDGTWVTALQPYSPETGKYTDDLGGTWSLVVNEGKVSLTDAFGTSIMPKGADTNGISSGAFEWEWTYADGTYSFASTADGVTLAANISSSGMNQFRAYKNSTITGTPDNYLTAFTLYKLEGEVVCEHEITYIYTETKHTKGCSICEEALANEEFHDTEGENGTCSVCGYAVDADVLAAAIMEAAYALESGASLDGTYTLTGTIVSVDSAWSDQYSNITVTINVAGKTIQCYRMKGEGASTLGLTDVITVTGTIKNYNGTVEFDSGCQLVSAVYHEHNYSYVANGTLGHYQQCSICSVTTDTVPHTDADADAACDTCGSTELCTHNFVITHDGAHVETCSLCSAVNPTEYVIADDKDADGHWTACSCGVVTVEKVAHTYTDGKCSCGFVEPLDIDDYFKKIELSANIADGYYMIYGLGSGLLDDGVTNKAFMGATADSKNRLLGNWSLVHNCTTVTNTDANLIWQIISTEGGYYIRSAATLQYLYFTGSSNAVYLTDDIASAGIWTITAGEDGWIVVDTASSRQLSATRLGSAGNYSIGFAAYAASSNPRTVDLYAVTADGTGHTAAEAVKENVVDATCGAAGSYDSVVYCSVCNAEMSRETIATEATGEHNYVDGTCSVCGDKEVTGPATDDALVFFGTPGLSFQDYIGLQIMLKNSVAKDYDSFYVEITQVDFEGNATTIQTNGTPVNASYTVFEQQILSWSMTEQVTMTLYGVKGEEVVKGASFTTSVEALALDKIPSYVSSGDMARAKALVDMLNFGSAVQTSYSHNTTDLPNADLGELAQYGTTGDPEFTAVNDITGTNTIKIYSNNISMQSKVEFQFMVKTTALEGMTIVAKMGDQDIAVSYEVPMEGYTIIRVPCGAAFMRETFTIYITDANGALQTCTYNVTVEAYAAAQLSGEKAPAMKALLTYGDAVAAIG